MVPLPCRAGGAPESSRVGALLAARQLIRALGLRMVPYVLLLVVPLIGRMSDASPLARGLASACFASVVALVPLMDRVSATPAHIYILYVIYILYYICVHVSYSLHRQ